MRTATPIVTAGDWVYLDSPGIWRAYRVLQGVQRMRFSSKERKRLDRRQLVFSKRFLDGSWSPAFSIEMANGEFVRPLSGEDRKRLEEFIVQNPAVFRKFEAFEPESIDAAMDLRLQVPSSTGVKHVQRLIDETFRGIEAGFTNDELLQRLEASQLTSLVTMLSGNWTLRFLSKSHEIQSGEYIFRKVQLLMA